MARSANFPLYSNISARFVATLESFSDQVSQYSVDECFFILNQKETLGLEGYAKTIKDTLYKHLQLPAGIGISSTKTLSKVANYAAKEVPCDRRYRQSLSATMTSVRRLLSDCAGW